VIPGITDGGDNIRQIAEFARPLQGIRDIDLLPFHRIADGKYRRLGRENKMKTTRPPTGETMQRVGNQFRSYGFTVCSGG
jgi:pyruvate formate lyase activating enzyme